MRGFQGTERSFCHRLDYNYVCVRSNFPDEPSAPVQLRPRPNSPQMWANAVAHLQGQQQTEKITENTAWRNMFSV
jgi:hypothetical protein